MSKCVGGWLGDFIWVIRPVWDGGIWAEIGKMERKQAARFGRRTFQRNSKCRASKGLAEGGRGRRLLKHSGSHCARVIRQRGEVRAVGRPYKPQYGRSLKSNLRRPKSFPKTTCLNILLNYLHAMEMEERCGTQSCLLPSWLWTVQNDKTSLFSTSPIQTLNLSTWRLGWVGDICLPNEQKSSV